MFSPILLVLINFYVKQECGSIFVLFYLYFMLDLFVLNTLLHATHILGCRALQVSYFVLQDGYVVLI